ncbi:MAG: aldo/keto reductase [Acidimicrobiia bacterium]|nr:aldo/keto reductase [Acidimicrobiia bacterium]NNL28441.1 aldo/keto reductase [Acidimicrobiia bacterium]NNL47910.1 aldo/keto reductase [Acidimicrobiia bacterium]
MTSLVNSSRRTLGSLSVGPIAFGCWRFVGMPVDGARHVLESALDSGMNLIDTADVYGLDWGGTGFGQAEELLGEVLASDPSLRDRMVLATKGGIMPPIPYDSSGEYLEAACDRSLQRLRTDTIDLYQIHRPDLFTHPAELASVLTSLRASGKVREVGVSNYTPAQTRALQAHLAFPLVSTQPQFSASHLAPLRDGTLDLAMELGLIPLAWSPLGGGMLASGETGEGAPRSELIETLDRLAEREGVDRASIALAFILAHPSTPIPIIGSQKPDRIASSTKAFDVNLDRNDVYDIIEASEGVPLP